MGEGEGKRAGDGGGRGKSKRHKAKYLPNSQRRGHGGDRGGRGGGGGGRGGGASIAHGVSGFLVSCMGGRERESVREIILTIESFLDGDEAKEILEKARSEGHVEGVTNGAGVNEEGKSEGLPDMKEEEESRKEKENEKEGLSGEGEGNGGDKVVGGKGCEGDKGGGGGAGADIEKLLQEEIAELKKPEKRRLSSIETGCKALVFINMRRVHNAPYIPPCQVAEAIVRKTAETKSSSTRYSLRLLPIERTCYASEASIVEEIKPIISLHFPSSPSAQPKKFAIVVEVRANSGFKRMPLVTAVAALVPPPHSVDLTSPDSTIMLHILKTTCCIGVVHDFKKLAKYNLRQLCLTDEEAKEGSAKGEREEGEGEEAEAEGGQEVEEEHGDGDEDGKLEDRTSGD